MKLLAQTEEDNHNLEKIVQLHDYFNNPYLPDYYNLYAV